MEELELDHQSDSEYLLFTWGDLRKFTNMVMQMNGHSPYDNFEMNVLWNRFSKEED